MGTRSRSILGLGALCAALLTGACASAKKTVPEETNPLLTDLVDYRNAVTLLKEGQVDQALDILQHARSAHPRDANVPNALGLCLLYKRDVKGALRAFDEAVKLDPNLIDARNNRGVAYMDAGRLDLAEADFKFALEASTSADRVTAHYNLGLLHKKRGDWVDAEREISLALADDPRNEKALRERGLVRVKREDFNGALKDFLEVLKKEPQDPISNYQAALCLLTAGRRDLAIRYMERTTSAAPESDEGKRARRFLDSEPETPTETHQ